MSSVFLRLLDLIISCVLSLYKHKHTYTSGFVHDAKNGSFYQAYCGSYDVGVLCSLYLCRL